MPKMFPTVSFLVETNKLLPRMFFSITLINIFELKVDIFLFHLFKRVTNFTNLYILSNIIIVFEHNSVDNSSFDNEIILPQHGLFIAKSR